MKSNISFDNYELLIRAERDNYFIVPETNTIPLSKLLIPMIQG